MTFPGAYLPGQSLFQPQENTDQQSVMIDLSFRAFNKKWSYNVCILLYLDFFSLHNVEHVTVYQVICSCVDILHSIYPFNLIEI